MRQFKRKALYKKNSKRLLGVSLVSRALFFIGSNGSETDEVLHHDVRFVVHFREGFPQYHVFRGHRRLLHVHGTSQLMVNKEDL